ncbi:nucleotide exchange factor GrpE [Chroococcidiopsis sp. CCMEE 29]|jgi:molecular chaperone GrpE|uniref:nucleotide exchange factor GrpE n=1 Tax=Chroococcidiopsis sp. CCMEE 29 TaxID=155894 RepID=UPI002021EE81|nr:nucleotide exchange factor GrpE [Chroococcidiopsis sp. CCMEE 29]
MIDEEKIDNTADRQSDTSEDKQEMMSEATAETMNLNQEGTETTAQAAAANPPSAPATEENATAAAPMAEAEYQAVLSEMTQQIESLRGQLEERSSQYMRIAADFDNFRKRNQKEKEDLEQQVKRNTIMELLPVVDNFERARSHLKPQTDAEMSIHKSYQSVYKQLVDGLKRLGVSAMRPEGKEFDPSLHEAVMRQPTNEHPEGTVLEELVRGYFLGDRVLRHAMVKVAAATEEVIETSEEENPSSSAPLQ